MTKTTTERIRLDDTSLRELFSGYADGAYELPEAVTTAGAASLEAVSASSAAGAAFSGAFWRRGDSIAERDAYAILEDRRNLAATAARTALQRVESMVAGMGDQIVADYLRPAHTAALEAVRGVLPDLADVPDLADFDAVARAGAKAAAAYTVVVVARQRLVAIGAALEAVYDRQRLGGIIGRDVDRDARLGGALNDTPVWPTPGIATISKGARVRVGPRHPIERTRWLAGEGRGWCPTFSEWAAAFDAWVTDPARNGIRSPGPVPTVRDGWISRPGSRRTAPLR